MKCASGLVFAALAVTAANAGNPNYLRQTNDSVPSDAESALYLTRNPSSSPDINPDDLTIDLTEILGESTDGSHLLVNILDLIGDGSDQVGLDEIVEAVEAIEGASGSKDVSTPEASYKKDEGIDHMHVINAYKDNSFATKGHSSGYDDLPWINDIDEKSGSGEYAGVKGATKGAFMSGSFDEDSSSDDLSWLNDESDGGSKDNVVVKGATKGGFAYGKGQNSGSDDMAWLFADESGSGDFAGVKHASKGAGAFLIGEDPVAEKGAYKGAAMYDDDEDSGSRDLVSTKASKSSKKGAAGSALADLYEDGSDGLVGGDDLDDDKHPFFVAGATKGSTPVVEDDEDSESAADEVTQNDAVQSEKNTGDAEDDDVSIKSSKKILP